jgi:transcriptional regulator with XRE-family HTH domain
VPSELAPATPEVLKWARESIGASLEEAARRAAVSTDRVEAWERGDAEPTVAKLRALAKLYQRSLAVFFLPEPPDDFDAMRDFRRLPGVEDHSWSRALHKVFRRALEQQDVALELLDLEGEEPEVRLPEATVDEDPEDAAVRARSALGVTLAQQFAWRQPEEALAGWDRGRRTAWGLCSSIERRAEGRDARILLAEWFDPRDRGERTRLAAWAGVHTCARVCTPHA